MEDSERQENKIWKIEGISFNRIHTKATYMPSYK